MSQFSGHINQNPAPAPLPTAGLLITLAGGHIIPLDLAIASDHIWADLGEQIDQVDGDIVVELIDLPDWADEARWAALEFLHQHAAQCTFIVGDAQEGDLFEAVLAAMVGTTNMQAHRQSCRAAIEAAAICFSDAAEAAAGRINQRLQELGAPRRNYPQLVRQIRDLAGAGGGDEQVDARSVADAYVEHVRERLQQHHHVGDDDPILWYFRSYFYRWAGQRWERAEDAQMRARLMEFIQSLDGVPRTKKFVGDVVANLEAIALLDCWDQSPPFLVAWQEPLDIDDTPLLTFGNGMISLDDLIAEDPDDDDATHH